MGRTVVPGMTGAAADVDDATTSVVITIVDGSSC